MRDETKGLLVLLIAFTFIFAPPVLVNANYYDALVSWAEFGLFGFLSALIIGSLLGLIFDRENKNDE